MKDLPRYRTIEAPSKLYDTGAKPILVSVSDKAFNSYVVKHNNGLIPCSKLANELLAHYFLRYWKLKTPDAAIIEVQEKHIAELSNSARQPRFFRTPCWGTLFYANSTEFLRFLEQLQPYERQKFSNVTDLLRISLFDIWVANDDRTHNNPNTLVVSSDDGFEFWAMDHEAIFNGNNLGKEPYALNLEDTSLYHPALKEFLGNTLRDSRYMEGIVEDAYVCIDVCHVNLNRIVSFIPNEWNLDIARIKQELEDRLFSESWKKGMAQTFLQFVHEIN